MSGRGHIDVIALPESGRRFAFTRRVRFGDTDPSGRLRADAAAR